MSDPVIRLDRSKAFSECRGERTPDDPHYRVHFWQGGKVGDKIILLPFDAQGVLVHEDKTKDKPYEGVNVDGKPVIYQPLYNQDMRDLAERKLKRLSSSAAKQADAEEAPPADGEPANAEGDEVNLTAWLRGEVQYQPHEWRAAAKKRFHKNYNQISELVVDLVLDEKLVPESEVCPALAKYLPAKVAA